MTHVAGEDLSAERFRPIFGAIEELGLLVFMHPDGFTEARRFNDHYFANVIGNPLDTTVAVHHLIFGGVLEDYPGLKLVLAHGGGYLPAYSGRIDHAASARPLQFGNSKFGCLQRDRAQAGEAVGMVSDNIGDLVVERACGGQPEIRISTMSVCRGAGEIAWMSIPIRSMSAMRCSADVPCVRVRTPFWRLISWLRAFACVSRNQRETASLPSTIAAALRLVTWQWMSRVNHLPRACAGPGKRPGIGVTFRQTAEQHLGTPAHVGICGRGITSAARLSFHIAWSMFAGPLNTSTTTICAASRRKIPNADDGDARLKIGPMMDGP